MAALIAWKGGEELALGLPCDQISSQFRDHRMFSKHGLPIPAVPRRALVKMTLTHKTSGPGFILHEVEDRSGDLFDEINDIKPEAEKAACHNSAQGFGLTETTAAILLTVGGAHTA